MLETYDDEERHVFYHTHQNDFKINNFVIRNKGIIRIVVNTNTYYVLYSKENM